MFFYVQQKKQTHTGLEQLQGELMTDFHFHMNHPFKHTSFSQVQGSQLCGHEFHS